MNQALEQVRQFHAATGLSDRLTARGVAIPEEERALRRALLREEAAEVRDGLETGDVVAVADGLADMCYIAYGTAVTYGLNVDDHVHADAAAPVTHVDQAAAAVIATEVDAAVALYESAERTEDPDQLTAALTAVVAVCRSSADRLGIPLGAVFDEVQASNMSKVGSDGKVHRRDDGKVLKGEGYFPPDVRGVLAAAAA